MEPYHTLSSSTRLNPSSRDLPNARTMSSQLSTQYMFTGDSRYTVSSSSQLQSIHGKFTLSPDVNSWGLEELEEADDELHKPEPRNSHQIYRDGHVISWRGLSNLGCMILLIVGIITLFAGYPMITYFRSLQFQDRQGYNTVTNSTGQIPSIGNFGLIDDDTPQDQYMIQSLVDGSDLALVFSDEFNQNGRTFWPGDDPYWEAVDLHYWATNDLEWYNPQAITTSNGSLVITLSQTETHELNYQSGMMSTWNKFCFTGGYVAASVQLPGVNDIVGLWPSIWSMGNLGRAGYGASLDGMWPYTYDTCDVGTVANQTVNGIPAAATINGDPSTNDVLSYLPGQRLSRCTCSGEEHPGPVHSDGTYVGRSAPEIDMFEGQITGDPLSGQVSQSAQWAPFNHGYIWLNTTDNLIIADSTASVPNTYIGGSSQQATSVVTVTDQNCYQKDAACYSVYGFEYKPGFDDAYISWIANSKLAWTLKAAGMGTDSIVQIGPRPVPQEPMYLLINLGMSTNFGSVDLEHLPFPVAMSVDWIRVYQPSNAQNYGCEPEGFPTQAYINKYIEAYTDQNLTTWVDDYKQTIPKNSFLGQC